MLQRLLDAAAAHLGPAPTRLVLRKYWAGLAAVFIPLRLVRSSSRSGYSSSSWLVLSLLIGALGADAQVAPLPPPTPPALTCVPDAMHARRDQQMPCAAAQRLRTA